MNRHGAFFVLFIIGLIIAVLVAWIAIMGYSGFISGERGAGTLFEILFPTFGDSVVNDVESAVIGYSLADDQLYYFEGIESRTGWSRIPLDGDEFTLGNAKFNPSVVHEEVQEFYFATERKPDRLPVIVSDFLQWDVRFSDETLVIQETFREGYQFFSEDARYTIDYANVVRNAEGDTLDGRFRTLYGEGLDTALLWRDQILEEQEFEKFVVLPINAIAQQHTVRRNSGERFLIIDLDVPAEGVDLYSSNEYVAPELIEVSPGDIDVWGFAIAEARRRVGSYSDHAIYVDWLFEAELITAEEYKEINGDGLFNLEENMPFVLALLLEKHALISELEDFEPRLRLSFTQQRVGFPDFTEHPQIIEWVRPGESEASGWLFNGVPMHLASIDDVAYQLAPDAQRDFRLGFEQIVSDLTRVSDLQQDVSITQLLIIGFENRQFDYTREFSQTIFENDVDSAFETVVRVYDSARSGSAEVVL